MYNEYWTREKHIEYRKLKKSGYSSEMLIEHFGEDIYHSGICNKNGSTLPKIYSYENFLNEIKINPEKIYYSTIPQISMLYKNKTDYILTFNSDSISYIICLMYFEIMTAPTYNIIFTTNDQWTQYIINRNNFMKKGHITDVEFKILDNIIGKETELNNLFPILRKLSYILMDFYISNLKGHILSIGDTINPIKIKLYRNVIRNSFQNITEKEINVCNDKYYLYEISTS